MHTTTLPEAQTDPSQEAETVLPSSLSTSLANPKPLHLSPAQSQSLLIEKSEAADLSSQRCSSKIWFIRRTRGRLRAAQTDLVTSSAPEALPSLPHNEAQVPRGHWMMMVSLFVPANAPTDAKARVDVQTWLLSLETLIMISHLAFPPTPPIPTHPLALKAQTHAPIPLRPTVTIAQSRPQNLCWKPYSTAWIRLLTRPNHHTTHSLNNQTTWLLLDQLPHTQIRG